MKLVVDTNILLVSISPRSKYHWLFKKFLNEDLILCVTTDILQEYEEIIEKQMGVEIANFVLQIIENAVNVELVTKYYRWNLITVDPDDNKFVDCAVSSNANYLASNDKHFNVLKDIEFPKVKILNIDELETVLKK